MGSWGAVGFGRSSGLLMRGCAWPNARFVERVCSEEGELNVKSFCVEMVMITDRSTLAVRLKYANLGSTYVCKPRKVC